MLTRCTSGAAPFARRTSGVLLLAAAAALVALAVLPQAAPAKGKAQTVKVMTRNLYLGADLVPAIAAPTVPALEVAAGAIYEQMLANDFPARANLLAREIKQTKPHLLGLQEVTTWRRGPKGDPAPATTVVEDFLKRLKKALKKRGLKYETAVKVRNADVEVPTDKGLDARLTDYDVVLARKGPVKVQKTSAANFDAMLEVPNPVLGTVSVPRGYNEVNARVRGKRVHFVNTHLEAFIAAPRTAQAEELLKPGGPLQSKRPVILSGDLNSDPADAPPESDAYNAIIGAGFKDRGVSRNTCCWDADLLGGTLTSRVDHNLVDRGKGLSARVTGNKAKTSGGLLASDHLGVFSRIRIR